MQGRRRRQAAAAVALQIVLKGVPPGRTFPEPRSLEEIFSLHFPETEQPLEESTENASAL